MEVTNLQTMVTDISFWLIKCIPLHTKLYDILTMQAVYNIYVHVLPMCVNHNPLNATAVRLTFCSSPGNADINIVI